MTAAFIAMSWSVFLNLFLQIMSVHYLMKSYLNSTKRYGLRWSLGAVNQAFEIGGIRKYRNPVTGDVILSRKPLTWNDFFSALEGIEVPADFLDTDERRQGPQARDPVTGWAE